MAGGVVSKTLPEELVEKIVAMMPFPLIFKARLLSKSWQARFQSIQSQDDQEQKRRARSFQKQVTEWSNRWERFSHVCMPEEDNLTGLDQTLRTQQRLPSLSFLPEKLCQTFLPEKLYEAFVPVKCYSRTYLGGDFSLCAKSYLQIEGPFLYGMLDIDGMCHEELYVANILTREYKKLPARPNLDQFICCVKLLIEPSAQTYKLILICKALADRGGGEHLEGTVQTYDSKANTWSSQEAEALTHLNFMPSMGAYFNGVLYMFTSDDVQRLLAYNLEERLFTVLRLMTLTGLPLPFNEMYHGKETRLVVCDGSLMMIVTEGESEDEELETDTVRVLKIDVESQRVWEVAQRPPAMKRFTDIPVSHYNYLFFGTNQFARLMVAYDERNKEWNFVYPKKFHRLSAISFQPGLQTFMAV